MKTILALGLIFFSFSLNAEDTEEHATVSTKRPSPSEHLVCRDPVAWICGDDEQMKKSKEAYVKVDLLRRYVSDSVEDNVLESHKDDASLAEASDIYRALYNFTANKEEDKPFTLENSLPKPYVDYLTGIYQKIDEIIDLNLPEGKRIKDITRDLLLSDANLIITDRKTGRIRIDNSAKSRMAETVNKIRTIDSFKMLNTLFDNYDDFNRNFEAVCGADGMEDSAFYIYQKNVVVPCPGLIVGSVSGEDAEKWLNEVNRRADEAKNGPQNAEPIPKLKASSPKVAFTLAHETGHAVDSTNFQENYRVLARCLYLHNKELPSGEKVGTLSTVYSFLPEIVADFQAARTLAKLLDDEAFVKKNGDNKFQIVKQATYDYCHYVSESKIQGHPEGQKYRLGAIVGTSPELRQALGCAPKPSCTLSGWQEPGKSPTTRPQREALMR